MQGSADEVLRINVLEGPQYALPEANKAIGYLEISGKNISRNVHKGSDLEITLQMSESRDLVIAVYLTMADQEFKQTFNPKERHTLVSTLRIESEKLSEKLDKEIQEATDKENYESAKELSTLRKEMEDVVEEVTSLSDDDVTDKRYQLEDKKRKIAQSIDNATRDKRIATTKMSYFDVKNRCLELIDEGGNDHERKLFNDVVSQENIFLSSTNPLRIQERSDELHSIIINILWRTPAFLVSLFKDLTSNQSRMNDQNQAKSLLDAGKFAIESENWDRLSEINSGLLNLLPKSSKAEITTKIGF